MDLYNKTQRPKNSKGKASALLFLISGGMLFIVGGSEYVKFPALVQLVGISLITISIYIASAYLLRELCFAVVRNDRQSETATDNYDMIIRETRGKKQTKLCHFTLSDIKDVRIADAENKKQVEAERKNMKRYIYDSEFLSVKRIEIKAFLDGEDHSILIAFDEELYDLLKNLTESVEN